MAQCTGWTQKGERCKRTAVEGSVYCNTHEYQADLEDGPRTKRAEHAQEAGDAGTSTGKCNCWTDPSTWDRETVLLTALGVVLAGALVLSRGRR